MKTSTKTALCSALAVLMSTAASAGFVSKNVTWRAGPGANQHTYYLVDFAGESWNSSVLDSLYSIGPGAYLATITSQEEQDLLVNGLLSDVSGEYWLGGYQFPTMTSAPDQAWSWVTGETWDYTNWIPYEPNDQGGPGAEQYLGLKTYANYQWNDEGYLHNINGYIAESVPEPGSLLLLGAGLVGIGASLAKARSNRQQEA